MLSVNLSNRLSELDRLSRVIGQFGHRQGLPDNVLNCIQLAVEEIVANVISHGYDDQNEHSITVRLAFQDGMVLAEVEDDGRPFNPLDAPEPKLDQPLEDRPIGGLGIHLVRNLMDALDYRHTQGKNLLRMKKRVSDRP